MTPRQRVHLLVVLASAALLVIGLVHVLGADRPVCRYPLEMYRPSLNQCVLKASYRAAGGERRTRRRWQRHRRPPPADDVPVQIERTEPPKIRPDPPLDGVWPAPPTAFEMRFYGVGE